MVSDIPLYPSLVSLDISNTRVCEIPVFPRLIDLHCSGTVLKSVILPRLRYLFAYNCRLLTCIGQALFQNGFIDGCVWLRPEEKRIQKLIKIQRFFKKTVKRYKMIQRLKLIKYIPLDLVNITISYV
jgi:hypothetical protein